MAKLSAKRRALLLANAFNLLAGVYFTVIAVVGLVQLRWYHQLTVTVRLRHLVTSATSYFAFILLIFVALLLMAIFVASSLQAGGGGCGGQPASQVFSFQQQQQQRGGRRATRRVGQPQVAPDAGQSQEFEAGRRAPFVGSHAGACCSSLVYLLASLGLLLVLLVWLVNTGELVRESIMSQLELAFAKYQFFNRSNHHSIAVDAMQDTNHCCGSLDYTDFPRFRHTGLSSGHYPGSCCGKITFGVNARVVCSAEEVWRAKQTVSRGEMGV